MFSRILSVSRNYLARSVHKIATQPDSTQLIKLSDSRAATNVHLRLHLQEYSKDRIVSFHEIDKRIRKDAGKSFSEFHAEFLSCLSSASSVELRNSAIRKLSFRLDGVPAFMAAYKIFLGKLTKKTNGQIFNAMLNELLSNDSDSALNFFPVVMALEEKMQLSNEDALLIFENMNKLNWRFIAIIMCRAMDSEKGIWPLIRLMLSNDQKFLVETLSLLSSTFTFDDSMYIIANLNADELSEFKYLCEFDLAVVSQQLIINLLVEQPALIKGFCQALKEQHILEQQKTMPQLNIANHFIQHEIRSLLNGRFGAANESAVKPAMQR